MYIKEVVARQSQNYEFINRLCNKELFLGDIMEENSLPAEQESINGKISLRGAVFIGIGSMVGAGIFALFGEAGTIAGAAVGFLFLLPESSLYCRAIPSPSWALAIPPQAG